MVYKMLKLITIINLTITLNMGLSSIFESPSSEQRWISQINQILAKEVRVEIDDPVSIFRVPATLSVFKPEAYVPQLVALGPYHHFRTELYEMERYKLASASRLQKQFQSLEFKQLVNGLKGLEHRVRACYHKYLDIEGETLTWIMAIDGLFLLDFLRCYHESTSTTTAYLVDSAGKKLAHGSVLSDIVMLENQIPIFVLSEILSIQCSRHPEVADSLLPSILLGFCKSVSPLQIQRDLTLPEVSGRAHILDLLYHLIVPEFEGPHEPSSIKGATNFDKTMSLDSSKSYEVFTKLWDLLSNAHVVSKITKPIKKVIDVSGKMVSSFPGLSMLASKKKEDAKPEDRTSGEEKKTPVVEEIMIPSVSRLCNAGVEFCPTTGGINSVGFDMITMKFHLPVITLDVNSEVVMRNLVAYEASVESESLVFMRYTELMNGIIDTPNDAKLLRENKIIVNSLKSDADVAQLFNGMSKSVRLTSVPFIDKTIEDVNAYFHSTRAVRMYKRMKRFVYGSWKMLTVLAVVLLMLLLGLQSFCSVYSCPKLFHTISQ